MDKELIRKLSERRNSFYLYDEKTIKDNIKALKDNFPNVDFLYSVKTNPYPLVVKTVLNGGFGIDAASLGEVKIGLRNGLTEKQIFYSAPGKTDSDLKKAMGKSIITVDSIGELKRLEEIAKSRGIKIDMAARLNPNFTMDSNEGHSSKFGIDEQIFFENIESIRDSKYLNFTGIHVHSRSQELDYKVLANYYKNMFDLAQRVEEALGRPLGFINLGGGLGVDFGEDQSPLDIEKLGQETTKLVDELKNVMPTVKVYIETGRYAVCKAGIYVTKVIDKKESFGKNYIILHNTMNGFVRPSIAQMVVGYAGDDAKANEPMFTRKNAFKMQVISESEEMETVNLCGNLCTGQDVIATDVSLPKMQIGDLVVLQNAGAYAIVITPLQFASQEPPEELFHCENGKIFRRKK